MYACNIWNMVMPGFSLFSEISKTQTVIITSCVSSRGHRIIVSVCPSVCPSVRTFTTSHYDITWCHMTNFGAKGLENVWCRRCRNAQTFSFYIRRVALCLQGNFWVGLSGEGNCFMITKGSRKKHYKTLSQVDSIIKKSYFQFCYFCWIRLWSP